MSTEIILRCTPCIGVSTTTRAVQEVPGLLLLLFLFLEDLTDFYTKYILNILELKTSLLF